MSRLNCKNTITVTFTCPKLTGDMIHTIFIKDVNLLDTWDIFSLDGEFYNHEVNIWADGDDTGLDWDDDLGDMDMVKFTMYPLIKVRGETETNYSIPIPCVILNIEGDKNIITRKFVNNTHFGYAKDKVKIK